jgi:hypothetical protein
LMVPFELLSDRPLLRGDSSPKKGQRYTQIAVLWIDESALPFPKFDSLARLANALFKGQQDKPMPQLTIIGPSSSNALRTALQDLAQASKCASKGGCSVAETREVAKISALDREVINGYALLAKAEFLSPSVTAANQQIRELNGQKLESYLNEKFSTITGGGKPAEVKFKRMIATDSVVLKHLVTELNLRISQGESQRVVLVAERDSLYAQALVSELQYMMRASTSLQFEVVYFFRGLDGITTRDAADNARGAADRSQAGKLAGADPLIEAGIAGPARLSASHGRVAQGQRGRQSSRANCGNRPPGKRRARQTFSATGLAR